MVGRPQENSVMTSTVTLQPLIANHATIPHVIAMNLPFHVRYSSLICYKKLKNDRLFCTVLELGRKWVPQPLSLPTGCFSELWRLSYLIWKRGIRATCCYKNQHYCPTDRYFMAIFDVYLGSDNHPLHFGLSLCSPLKDIKLPYTRWKGTYIAFIWGRVAWSAPRGCRAMEFLTV